MQNASLIRILEGHSSLASIAENIHQTKKASRGWPTKGRHPRGLLVQLLGQSFPLEAEGFSGQALDEFYPSGKGPLEVAQLGKDVVHPWNGKGEGAKG